MNMNMNRQQQQTPSYASDPNTTFVQADPSNFRNIVQKLTGAPPDLSSPTSSSTKQSFKLHERRRQSSKKMELNVNNITDPLHRGFLVSPVSHLDPFWARVSPHSAPLEIHNNNMSPPLDDEEEHKSIIAERGFYVLPSPRSTSQSSTPPQLLPLFPLSSPTSSSTTNHRIQDN